MRDDELVKIGDIRKLISYMLSAKERIEIYHRVKKELLKERERAGRLAPYYDYLLFLLDEIMVSSKEEE